MRKTAFALATAATLGLTAIAVPAPAEAGGGWGAYADQPGYLYFHGYVPAEDSGYGPDAYGAYVPAYYDYGGGYAPAYDGYRHRAVFRPPYYWGRHHRWHWHG